MIREQIEIRINLINNEIHKLEEKIKEYENMNKKITETASSLASANNSLSNACSSLSSNYSSTIAAQKLGELQGESSKVSGIENELSGNILAASNKKMREMEEKIIAYQREISNLRSQLIQLPFSKW